MNTQDAESKAIAIFNEVGGDRNEFINLMLERRVFIGANMTLDELYNAVQVKLVSQAVIRGVQVVTTTDCRSEDGVTVGILDSIITMCRLYKGREVTPAVREALRDLATDEDFAKLLNDIKSS